MGINKLLPEFPGGPMTSAKAGFDLLNPLLQGDETTDVDMGTLVYVCALKHKNTYNGGNYTPALREFHRRLTILTTLHGWKMNCIFDMGRHHQKKDTNMQDVAIKKIQLP